MIGVPVAVVIAGNFSTLLLSGFLRKSAVRLHKIAFRLLSGFCSLGLLDILSRSICFLILLCIFRPLDIVSRSGICISRLICCGFFTFTLVCFLWNFSGKGFFLLCKCSRFLFLFLRHYSFTSCLTLSSGLVFITAKVLVSAGYLSTNGITTLSNRISPHPGSELVTWASCFSDNPSLSARIA